MKPAIERELMAGFEDDSKRKPAKKFVHDAGEGRHSKPPAPSLTLEQSSSFQDLAKNLDRKANEYAARGKQSLAARTEAYLKGKEDDPETDEVNYGFLESNNRMIAEIVREILSRTGIKK